MVTWTVFFIFIIGQSYQETRNSHQTEIGSSDIRESFQDCSAKVHCEVYTSFHLKYIILLVVLSHAICPSLLQLSILKTRVQTLWDTGLPCQFVCCSQYWEPCLAMTFSHSSSGCQHILEKKK